MDRRMVGADKSTEQCDQTGRFIGLWASFQTLWQQLICPNIPHSQAIVVKVLKYIIFLKKSFLGNFYRHLAIFSGHTDHSTYVGTQMLWTQFRKVPKYTYFKSVAIFSGHTATELYRRHAPSRPTLLKETSSKKVIWCVTHVIKKLT